MPIFHRLLVPVDLTDKNLAALEVATRLAAPAEGRVTLLHVIETIEDLGQGELDDFYRRLEERAKAEMRSLIGRTAAVGVELHQEISYGKRAQEIVRYSDRERVDLIVLSSHRVDPDRPGDSWATLSYKIAILAQCPVLLVK